MKAMTLSDLYDAKEKILKILECSDIRLTPLAYAEKISRELNVSIRDALKALNQLVEDQELSYHYIYGSTYIEKNFLKPVCIAEKFVLVPLGLNQGTDSGSGKINIMLESGISFGSGRHPTTRLCLEAIKWSFFKNSSCDLTRPGKGADIGTGSGVLAIAMCLSGLESCTAYEIDPVSLNEAEKNIKSNHLEDRITLVDRPMTEPEHRLSCICANLRWPTLKNLADIIHESLNKKGIVILSGIREWEACDLERIYSHKGFKILWHGNEKQWAGFVLARQ